MKAGLLQSYSCYTGSYISNILANIFIIFDIEQSDYSLDAPGQNNIKFNSVDKSTFLWYSWLYRYTVLI